MSRGYLLIMSMILIFAVAILPTWTFTDEWGQYPTLGFGFVLVTLFILAMAGLMNLYDRGPKNQMP